MEQLSRNSIRFNACNDPWNAATTILPGEKTDTSSGTRETSTASDESEGEDSNNTLDTEEDMMSFPKREASIAIAYAKHTIIANLMREVYSRFASPDSPLFRSCTTSCSGSPGASSNPGFSSRPLSQLSQGKAFGKRLLEDRDLTPPGDDDRNKRRRDVTSTPSQNPKRPFACPFHKYDPRKYSINETSGSR